MEIERAIEREEYGTDGNGGKAGGKDSVRKGREVSSAPTASNPPEASEVMTLSVGIRRALGG